MDTFKILEEELTNKPPSISAPWNTLDSVLSKTVGLRPLWYY